MWPARLSAGFQLSACSFSQLAELRAMLQKQDNSVSPYIPQPSARSAHIEELAWRSWLVSEPLGIMLYETAGSITIDKSPFVQQTPSVPGMTRPVRRRPGAQARVTQIEHFRPGRPVPTHRLAQL